MPRQLAIKLQSPFTLADVVRFGGVCTRQAASRRTLRKLPLSARSAILRS